MWKMEIKIEGRDFNALKALTQQALARIAEARTYKDLQYINMGCSDLGGQIGGYHATFSCPIEDHIAQLRQEANELEASLDAVHPG